MPAAGVPKAVKIEKLSAQEVIHAISHPTRWKILQALDTQMTSKEVGKKCRIAPALAQYHLKELFNVGLVSEHDLPESERTFVYRRRNLKVLIDISGEAMVVEVTR